MDEVLELRNRVRRGPWTNHDLNDVFAQKNAVDTIPGGVASDIGLPPETTRYITSYVRNGDFASLPPDTTATINDITNKLPDWRFVTVQGSSITAAMVADASAASGYVLRFTCASGNINDEVYIEQIVPIMSNRKGAWAAWCNAYLLAASAGTATFVTKLEAQYLKLDEVTTTGIADDTTTVFVAFASEPTVLPAVSGTAPGDASFMRIRMGVRRTATNATTATQNLANVFLNVGSDLVLIADDEDPTKGPASIIKRSGVAILYVDVISVAGARLEITQADLTTISYGNTYGVRARRTTNQSIANATEVSINLNATDTWDIANLHDTVTANARVTFAKAGWYLVGGGVEFAASAAGDRSCYIELNGTDGAGTRLQPWTRTTAAAALETALQVSFMYHFDANDFIALTVRQNSGGALNVAAAALWAQLMMAD